MPVANSAMRQETTFFSTLDSYFWICISIPTPHMTMHHCTRACPCICPPAPSSLFPSLQANKPARRAASNLAIGKSGLVACCVALVPTLLSNDSMQLDLDVLAGCQHTSILKSSDLNSSLPPSPQIGCTCWPAYLGLVLWLPMRRSPSVDQSIHSSLC